MNRPGDIRTHPERPSLEPEIIPPGAYDPRAARAGFDGSARARQAETGGVFISVEENGRVHERRFRLPGPLALALMLFVFIGLAGTLALLAFGFVLIWVPIAVLIVAGALAAGLVRSYWRRLAGARN